jgi:hypothetical protein
MLEKIAEKTNRARKITKAEVFDVFMNGPACTGCDSCVGVRKKDGMETIANDQGNRTTPSFVALADTEPLLVIRPRVRSLVTS